MTFCIQTFFKQSFQVSSLKVSSLKFVVFFFIFSISIVLWVKRLFSVRETRSVSLHANIYNASFLFLRHKRSQCKENTTFEHLSNTFLNYPYSPYKKYHWILWESIPKPVSLCEQIQILLKRTKFWFCLSWPQIPNYVLSSAGLANDYRSWHHVI